jgi:hypothetical protein
MKNPSRNNIIPVHKSTKLQSDGLLDRVTGPGETGDDVMGGCPSK